jgi:tetratricopeptide (TPR) repeat protein
MAHRTLAIAVVIVLTIVEGAQSQPQPQPQNLQYFPKDIPRAQLIQRMREFSFALGVRCEYCHDAPEGVPPSSEAFASDARPAKLKARAMLKMVDQLNSSLLAAIPARAEPRVEVSCVTCHRGLPLPRTLQTTLFEIVKVDGAAAAVARYRQLRETETLSGRYNFGEWEINELARRLEESGDRAGAITILAMNGEFYPKSASIDFMMAELHFAQGDREKALRHYRLTLEKNPQHQTARRRVAELQKQ